MTRMGTRIKSLRELFGLTREQFATLCRSDATRLKNIEQLNAKVNEDDIEGVCGVAPEFCDYIAYGGAISLPRLRASSNSFCAIALAKLEHNLAPPGYDMESFVKDDAEEN